MKQNNSTENQEDLDENGHPPVKDGYVRIYEDHTGRWYNDIIEEEYKEFKNSPEMVELRNAVQEEIDKEILNNLRGQTG